MKITYLFEYILIFTIFSKGLIFITRVLLSELTPSLTEKLTILTIIAGIRILFLSSCLKLFFLPLYSNAKIKIFYFTNIITIIIKYK